MATERGDQSTAPIPIPAAQRWQVIPDDLPIIPLLRWLHGNRIEHHYGGSGTIVYLMALISDEGYAALLRDVRTPATQEVSR